MRRVGRAREVKRRTDNRALARVILTRETPHPFARMLEPAAREKLLEHRAVRQREVAAAGEGLEKRHIVRLESGDLSGDHLPGDGFPRGRNLTERAIELFELA